MEDRGVVVRFRARKDPFL